MELKLEIPQVRVVKACDYKGNPVTYLEVLGALVLYARPDHNSEDTMGGLSVGAWEDVFRTRLADLLATLLLGGGGLERWSEESPTGQEVHTMDTVELRRED